MLVEGAEKLGQEHVEQEDEDKVRHGVAGSHPGERLKQDGVMPGANGEVGTSVPVSGQVAPDGGHPAPRQRGVPTANAAVDFGGLLKREPSSVEHGLALVR